MERTQWTYIHQDIYSALASAGRSVQLPLNVNSFGEDVQPSLDTNSFGEDTEEFTSFSESNNFFRLNHNHPLSQNLDLKGFLSTEPQFLLTMK